MIKLYSVIILFSLETMLLIAAILLNREEKKNLSFFLYLLSLLPTIILGFVARSFSPSYCATFAIITHGLMFISIFIEYILKKTLPDKRDFSFIPLLIFAVGMAFSYPNVFIYCFQDDLLLTFCYITIGLTILGLFFLIMLNKKKSIPLWDKIATIVKQTCFFSAAVLSLLCGTRQTPVLPYGLGLAMMFVSSLINKNTRNLQVLPAVLFWLGYAISLFYTLTPAIIL